MYMNVRVIVARARTCTFQFRVVLRIQQYVVLVEFAVQLAYMPRGTIYTVYALHAVSGCDRGRATAVGSWLCWM